MTPDEEIKAFRENDMLRTEWAELMRHPIFQRVMAIMRRNAPEHRMITAGITPTFANIRLGHGAGYAEYEQTMEALAERPPTPDARPTRASYLEEPGPYVEE